MVLDVFHPMGVVGLGHIIIPRISGFTFKQRKFFLSGSISTPVRTNWPITKHILSPVATALCCQMFAGCLGFRVSNI